MSLLSKPALAMAILLALCLVGCKGSSKMIGTWNMAMTGNQNAVIDFKADNTMAVVFDDPGTHLKATIAGTFREDGDQLYMTWKNVDLTNVPAEGKGQEAEIKSELGKSVHVGEERVTTVAWAGDKNFSTTSSEGTKTTYTKA